MSLFGALQIGSRGLNASQLAINLTGQNISNANTEGYSRKTLDQVSTTRRDAGFGQMGFGVDVRSIERIRDTFLDRQIAAQMTNKGYFNQIDDALERIENVFTEPSNASLSESMSKFWDAWQDLANNPGDIASREVVRSSAQVMINQIHSLAGEMVAYRDSRDDVIDQQIQQVNGLSLEIFNLNTEIAVTELTKGDNANDSRDRRDLLIKKMSEIIDVNFIEDEQGRITVTTDGNIIVSPGSVVPIEVVRKSSPDASGKLISDLLLRFDNSKKEYTPNGGSLRGLLDVKKEVMPKYMASLDELVGALVKEVNDMHSNGYNLNQNTGVSFFDIAKTSAMDITLSSAVSASPNNIAAGSGGTTQGPFTAATVIPPSATPNVYLPTINNAYRNLVQGSIAVVWNGQTLDEGAGKDYVVDYQNGVVQFINYARYPAGAAVSISLRYNDGTFAGNGDGTNALAIAKLRDNLVMGKNNQGESTQKLSDYYASFIGDLGIERNQAKSNIETTGFLVDQFVRRQEEVAGVSIDEEMANMIKFEHTYQASARFITTIGDMLDVLMSIAGR